MVEPENERDTFTSKEGERFNTLWNLCVQTVQQFKNARKYVVGYILKASISIGSGLCKWSQYHHTVTYSFWNKISCHLDCLFRFHFFGEIWQWCTLTLEFTFNCFGGCSGLFNLSSIFLLQPCPGRSATVPWPKSRPVSQVFRSFEKKSNVWFSLVHFQQMFIWCYINKIKFWGPYLLF